MKAELRRALRARRRAFVAELAASGRLEGAAQAMADRVIAELHGARAIAGYWPAGSEADSRPALVAADAIGCTIALPRVHEADRTISFHRWRPGDALIPGAHGLLEPSADAPIVTPDLIVTPLIAFDRRLMRLGQGAGYYDRLFARYPDVRRIGLAWSVQEVEEAPADPWDVPLHGLATEREWIEAETA